MLKEIDYKGFVISWQEPPARAQRWASVSTGSGLWRGLNRTVSIAAAGASSTPGKSPSSTRIACLILSAASGTVRMVQSALSGSSTMAYLAALPRRLSNHLRLILRHGAVIGATFAIVAR